MGMIKYPDVPSYLAAQPDKHRVALENLRSQIYKFIPDGEDTMSYGMPAVALKGKNVVAYAGFKNHCSFFPMSGKIVDQFAEELKDYTTSKGTIQFNPDAPLPEELIRKIIVARLADLGLK